MVLPKLAVAIGLDEAIVVQQFYYLAKNPANGSLLAGHRWLFNTLEDWQQRCFPFWSTRTLKRIFRTLREMHILEVCQPEGVLSRRNYYRLNEGMLNLIRKGKLQIPRGIRSKSRRGHSVPIDRPFCPLPPTETPFIDSNSHFTTGSPPDSQIRCNVISAPQASLNAATDLPVHKNNHPAAR